MGKADKNKLLYLTVLGLFLLVLAGCTDTSVENISQNFNYKSQVKFVNLAPLAGTATINVNGEAFGNVEFGSDLPGDNQSFKEIDAGKKEIIISYSTGNKVDTFKISTETEKKMRLYILGDSTHHEIFKVLQRYTWQEKGSANGKSLFLTDTAQVTILNASPDAAFNQVHIKGNEVDSTIDYDSPVSFKMNTSYIKLKTTGNPTYTLELIDTENDAVVSSISLTVSSQGRYTAVIYDFGSILKKKVFTDD